MSSFESRATFNKRTLSLNEHKSILRKLTKGIKIEENLKCLYTHGMDENVKESEKIVDVLKSLCNSSQIGLLAEFTLRQWLNREGRTIEPIGYQWERVFVADIPKKRRSAQKSRSLGLEFLHWQISSRIAVDPDCFEREKETEQFMELMQGDFCFSSQPDTGKILLKRKCEEEESCPVLSKLTAF